MTPKIDPALHTDKKPDWIRVKLPRDPVFWSTKALISDLKLHTVCEEAQCPNRWECWSQGTATFMIAGDRCTRACGFCAVKTAKPFALEADEPQRVAQAVKRMKLNHIVITAVARDDVKDGGASIFAETIRETRARLAHCRIEVLIPDFKGEEAPLRTVLDAGPDVLNHNTETVPRLYRQVRLGARYERSLDMLRYAKSVAPEVPAKSGLMLGLGETLDEVRQVMRDLRAHDVDILTLGQYLRPSPKHLPIIRYVPQSDFDDLKRYGVELGFKHVESGPLVRSSYHADAGAGALK